MENKDVWRSSSLVFSFFSVPYLGLGSVMSGTGAASFHNLVLRDGVIGVQCGYFTIFDTFTFSAVTFSSEDSSMQIPGHVS